MQTQAQIHLDSDKENTNLCEVDPEILLNEIMGNKHGTCFKTQWLKISQKQGDYPRCRFEK